MVKFELFQPHFKSSGYDNVAFLGDNYKLATKYPFERTQFDYHPRHLGIKPYEIKKTPYPYDYLFSHKIHDIKEKNANYKNPYMETLHPDNIKVKIEEVDTTGPFAPHFKEQTKDVIVPNEALHEMGIQNTNQKDFLKANLQTDSGTTNTLNRRVLADETDELPAPFLSQYKDFLDNKTHNENIDKQIEKIQDLKKQEKMEEYHKETKKALKGEKSFQERMRMKVGEITDYLEHQKKSLPNPNPREIKPKTPVNVLDIDEAVKSAEEKYKVKTKKKTTTSAPPLPPSTIASVSLPPRLPTPVPVTPPSPNDIVFPQDFPFNRLYDILKNINMGSNAQMKTVMEKKNEVNDLLKDLVIPHKMTLNQFEELIDKKYADILKFKFKGRK